MKYEIIDVKKSLTNNEVCLYIDNIKIKYSDYVIKNGHDQEYYYFKIEKSIKLITPGFNRIFGNPYVVSVERYIPYDE